MNDLAKLEVLLFVAGEEGLTSSELVSFLELSLLEVEELTDQLSTKYKLDETCALCVIKTAGRFRVTSKEIFTDFLKEYAKSPINQSLSKAAFETLSIIAYKEPITRIEVDNIRGVNSQGAITTLQTYNLVEAIGKKEVVGNPNLYATTEFFLDYLGINSLDDLPAFEENDFEVSETILFEDDE